MGKLILLPDLVGLREARRRLMNTTLFHEAIVAMKSMESYNIDITVEVKKKKMVLIFPIPIFETGRQTLNQWISRTKKPAWSG